MGNYRSSGSSDNHTSEPDPDDSHVAHYKRYAIFVVLEGGFTVLAWYCYYRPRLLPGHISYFEISTLKSGFITFFNVWHTIAIACASEICYEAFSREWNARGKKTDKVSKVTGGLLGRVEYAFLGGPTKTFLVAFIVFLGLVVMNNTGTSAVTASEGAEVEGRMEIGLINTQNLSPTSTTAGSSVFDVRRNEASMIVKLEQLYGAPWGYVPEPQWLIPLPAVQDLNMTQKVVYSSDLVHFSHNCTWQVLDQSLVANQVRAGNQTWSGSFYMGSAVKTATRNASSILQLIPQGPSTGSSAYLFLGGNMSFPLNSTNPNEAWIDLSGLPTVSPPGGIFSNRLGSSTVVRAPIAALLICDPNLTFHSGSVQLKPVSNITAPDVTVDINSGERVYNIDQFAARSLFTSILVPAINEEDPVSPTLGLDFIGFNVVAGQLSLSLPPWHDRDYTTLGGVHPFDLASINENIDKSMTSAFKAFTSGYDGDTSTSQLTGEFTRSVDARSTRTLSTLSTNPPFAILQSVLFGVLVIGLAKTLYLNRTQDRKPFTLKVLEAELCRDGRQESKRSVSQNETEIDKTLHGY